MDKEKVKQLAENVNQLLVNFHNQQATTAKLFQICLEFLEDNRRGHWTEWGGGLAAAKAAATKHKERKQQLIAAIKGYIEMIEKRGGEDVRNQHG